AERRGDHGGKRKPRLARDGPRRTPWSGAERLGRAANARVNALHGGSREGGREWQGETDIAQHDRLPCVEPPHGAEWSAARQQGVEQQTDDDGGKCERGVDDGQGRATAPKPSGSQEIAQRQPRDAGNGGGDNGDLEG